jgi:hypothetical protein
MSASWLLGFSTSDKGMVLELLLEAACFSTYGGMAGFNMTVHGKA